MTKILELRYSSPLPEEENKNREWIGSVLENMGY